MTLEYNSSPCDSSCNFLIVIAALSIGEDMLWCCHSDGLRHICHNWSWFVDILINKDKRMEEVIFHDNAHKPAPGCRVCWDILSTAVKRKWEGKLRPIQLKWRPWTASFNSNLHKPNSNHSSAGIADGYNHCSTTCFVERRRDWLCLSLLKSDYSAASWVASQIYADSTWVVVFPSSAETRRYAMYDPCQFYNRLMTHCADLCLFFH